VKKRTTIRWKKKRLLKILQILESLLLNLQNKKKDPKKIRKMKS
jgi:hypothetical protein